MLKDRQTQSLASGSDVKQYLKVNHVSSWLVLALVAIVLACVFAWLAIGTIRTTVSIDAVSKDGTLCSYVSPSEVLDFREGQQVEYDGKAIGTISSAENTVLTREQVVERIGDEAISSQLTLNEKNVVVHIDTGQNSYGDGMLKLTVVLAEMRPFDILST